MHTTPSSVVIALALAGVFGLAGLLQLMSPKPLRALYDRWRYPRGFERVTGALELVAAVFLAIGETRIWGVLLAAFITFTAVVTLLNRGKYLYAATGMLLLAALAPATLASTI